MQRINVFFLSTMVLLLLASCAPSVEFVSEATSRPPKPDDYEMIYIDGTDRLSDSTEVIGMLKVSGKGFYKDPGFTKTLLLIEEKAKLVGADAIQLTEVKPPDRSIARFRIKASAIAYTGSDTGKITSKELLAPMDMIDSAFINFNDCSLCYSAQDSLAISKEESKILLIPVGIFTFYVDDARVSADYPITEARIDEHLSLLLKSYNWNVEFIEDTASYYSALSDYYSSLLDNISFATKNPPSWNLKDSLNIVDDPDTYFYIPIAAQRYTQDTRGARFYALVVDNKGKVLTYSCLEYDPVKWSRNFNTFANDIEGKLPLIKEDNEESAPPEE